MSSNIGIRNLLARRRLFGNPQGVVGWGALHIGHRFADDRCLRRGDPYRRAMYRALSCQTSRTAQITPGDYLEGQASSAVPGRGVRVRCRSVTRKAVTDAYGEGTPPGVQRSPDNSSPPGVSLACQSRRVPSAVTAMSHERNGKV